MDIDFQIVTSFINQDKQSLLEVEGRFVKGNELVVGSNFDFLLIIIKLPILRIICSPQQNGEEINNFDKKVKK